MNRLFHRLASLLTGAAIALFASSAHAASGTDLTIGDVTVSTGISPAGSSVAVGCSVKNAGDTSADASRLKYYFSTDASYGAADTYLNYDNVPVLAGGAAIAESANVKIPATAPEGWAFILLVADHGAVVAELDEGNNVVAIPFLVGTATPVLVPVGGADLVLVDAALSAAQVDPGAVAVAQVGVRNAGEAAGASQLGYYLSKDAAFDASDVYLNYDTVDALANGAVSVESANVRVPATTRDGMYSILFVADRTGKVAEANETNNVASVRVAVGRVAPDLVVTAATIGAASARPGEAVPVTAVVQNLGEVRADVTQLKYFLSRDTAWDAADKQLSYDKVDALSEFAASSEDAALRISAATDAGHWYVLFVADADGTVAELSETNNVLPLALDIVTDDPNAAKADLVPTANALVPSFVAPGGAVVASTIVQNIGAVPAAASRVKYFLSTDATFDLGDRYINFDNIPELAVGVPSAQSASIPVPADLVFGTYYILFVADHTEEVAEQLESNNVVAVALTVGDAPSDDPIDTPDQDLPDLVVAMATIDTPSVQVGARATVRCEIGNVGPVTATNGSRAKYYLSHDDVFDAGDKYLGLDTVETLATNASSFEDVTPTIPTGTSAGTWFILIVADAAGDVVERVESNNVAAVEFNVAVDQPGAALPDLRIDGLTADKATVAPNARILMSGTFANFGSVTASESRLKFYLSSDRRRDSADAFLDYRTIEALGPRQTLPLAVSLRIPVGAAIGPQFILAVVDANAEIDETYESDNVVVFAVTVGTESTPLPTMPYACPSSIATDPGLLGLSTVATLNALHLGWDNKKDMNALACVASHFDLVGLVEVDAEAGLQSLVLALTALTHESWSYHVSDRAVGHDSSTEFYGFVWRTNLVTMTASLGFFDDPNDVIKREPYGASFEMGAFDFSLVVFHERYGDTMAIRRAEAEHLIEVYQYFQRVNGAEDDLLIGGDFNLAGNDAAFTLVGFDGVTSITDPEQKTSIGADGLASSFDNIFYSADHTSELLYAGAYNYLNGNHTLLRETVSDHIPVWMAVDTTHDDD